MTMRLTRQTLDVRTLGGIFGRCNIAAPAGVAVVATGTKGFIWLDQLNEATTSNIAGGVTRADANLFGGKIPNQEWYTIFGWQMQAFEVDNNSVPVDSAANIHESILDSLTFKIFMKGQEYIIGNLKPNPTGLGCGGTGGLDMNGGRAVAPFRFPASLPIQMSGNDTLYVEVTNTRAITLSGNAHAIEIFLYCPASKGIPVGQLSGA